MPQDSLFTVSYWWTIYWFGRVSWIVCQRTKISKANDKWHSIRFSFLTNEFSLNMKNKPLSSKSRIPWHSWRSSFFRRNKPSSEAASGQLSSRDQSVDFCKYKRCLALSICVKTSSSVQRNGRQHRFHEIPRSAEIPDSFDRPSDCCFYRPRFFALLYQKKKGFERKDRYCSDHHHHQLVRLTNESHISRCSLGRNLTPK